MKKIHLFILAISVIMVIAWFIADKSSINHFLGSKQRLKLITTQRVIDTNANGRIESSEIKSAKSRLLLYDKNKDGILSHIELGGPGTAEKNIRSAYMLRVLDVDADFELSKEELNLASERLLIMDIDKNGIIDSLEIAGPK